MSATQATPDDCSICLQALSEDTAHALPCTHRFHGSCVATWFRTRSLACPLCRDLPAEDDGQSVTSTDTTISWTTEDLLQNVSSETLQRMVSPLLRIGRNPYAPRRLRQLTTRFLQAQNHKKTMQRAWRTHERSAHGFYPVLKKVSSRLHKRVCTANRRLSRAGAALIRYVEEDP
jgi:hypothetical protein